jgi:hypothetical protein
VTDNGVMNSAEYLEFWYKSNADYLSRQCERFCISRAEFEGGASQIELDLGKYVSVITAWNNEYCMDIEIVNMETEEASFPVHGPCGSLNSFINRLDNHFAWIKEVSSNGT